jgi:membrane protein YqaA with SNARE-associated domain
MSIWAAVVMLVLAVAAYLAGDPMTLLSGVAELAVVLALFALVCAAELWN